MEETPAVFSNTTNTTIGRGSEDGSGCGIYCRHQLCLSNAYRYTEQDIVCLCGIQKPGRYFLSLGQTVVVTLGGLSHGLVVAISTNSWSYTPLICLLSLPGQSVLTTLKRRLTKILRHTLHVFVTNGFL